MWEQTVTKLMNGMGWGTGFRLPIADDDNLALEKKLEKLMRQVQERQGDLDDANNHVDMLHKGIKCAADLLTHDGKLVAAKRTEMMGENELDKLSGKDVHNLLLTCKTVQKAYQRLMNENNALVDELEMRRDDMMELADIIEYDRQNLVLLEKQASDETFYMELIQNLCGRDTETLNKYEARYRKTTAETFTMRRDLDVKVATTRMMQSDLEGLSDRFKKLHSERGEIVQMWKDTIGNLSSKDEEMKEVATAYAQADSQFKEVNSKIAQEEEKLENMSRSSERSSYLLSQWDRKVSELREALMALRDREMDLKQSILSYGSSITTTSLQLNQAAKAIGEIQRELEMIAHRIRDLELLLLELGDKLECLEGARLSADEKLKEITDLILEERNRYEELIKLYDKATDKKADWMGVKINLESKLVNVGHESRGTNANLIRTTAENKEMEILLERRKAAIYRLELQYLSIELRYLPLANPQSTDPAKFKEFETEIAELNMALNQAKKKKNFVIAQTDPLITTSRRIYKEKNAVKVEIEKIQALINGHRCFAKISTKTLDAMDEEFQNIVLKESMINLKVTQMKKAVCETKSGIYDSETHKLLIQCAGKEKRSEIDLHSSLLKCQRRNLKDEVAHLKFQLSQGGLTMDKNKKKYEIVMKLMSKGEEADEEEDEAYLVTKMANERETLVIERDKWMVKVREGEAETVALKNNLDVVNTSNEMFRESLKPVVDPAYTEEMNNIKQHGKDLIVQRTGAFRILRKAKDEMNNRLNMVKLAEHQKASLEAKLADKESQLRGVLDELSGQAQSVKRAKMLTSKLLTELAPIHFPDEDIDALIRRSAEFTNMKNVTSLDIKFKATKRKFEFGITTLLKVLSVYPYLFDPLGVHLVEQFGEEMGIKFLKRAGTLTGSSGAYSSYSTASSSFMSGSSEGGAMEGVASTPSIGRRSFGQEDKATTSMAASVGPPAARLSVDRRGSQESRRTSISGVGGRHSSSASVLKPRGSRGSREDYDFDE